MAKKRVVIRGLAREWRECVALIGEDLRSDGRSTHTIELWENQKLFDEYMSERGLTGKKLQRLKITIEEL